MFKTSTKTVIVLGCLHTVTREDTLHLLAGIEEAVFIGRHGLRRSTHKVSGDQLFISLLLLSLFFSVGSQVTTIS